MGSTAHARRTSARRRSFPGPAASPCPEPPCRRRDRPRRPAFGRERGRHRPPCTPEPETLEEESELSWVTSPRALLSTEGDGSCVTRVSLGEIVSGAG